MTTRYQKTDPITLYHHQKSHYQHIVHPRSTIRTSIEARKSLPLQRPPKSSNQKQRLRKIQNKKMLTCLLDIYSKQGLLTRIQEEGNFKPNRKNKSLYSSYKKQQQDRQIQKYNRDLFISILNIQPSIGSHKQWDRHFQNHLKMEKKLCNHLTKDYNGLTQFRYNFHREKIRHKLLDQQKQKGDTMNVDKIEDKSTQAPPLTEKMHQKRKKGAKKIRKIEQVKQQSNLQQNQNLK